MDTVCRQTPLRGAHNRLLKFIGVGRYVPRRIESWNARLLTIINNQVSCRILRGIESVDDMGIRLIPDCDKYSVHLQFSSVIQNYFLYTGLSFDRLDTRLKTYDNVRMFWQLVDPHGFSPKSIVPDEKINFFANLREK